MLLELERAFNDEDGDADIEGDDREGDGSESDDSESQEAKAARLLRDAI